MKKRTLSSNALSLVLLLSYLR